MQAPFLLDNSYLPKETNETKIMEKYLSDTYQVLDDLSSMTPYGGVRTPSEVCTLIFVKKIINILRTFTKCIKRSIMMRQIRLKDKFLLSMSTVLVSHVHV